MEVGPELEDQRTRNMKGLTVKNLKWMADPMENKPNYRFKEINDFPSPFEEKIIKEEKRKANIVSSMKEDNHKEGKNFSLFLLVGIVILMIGYKLSH